MASSCRLKHAAIYYNGGHKGLIIKKARVSYHWADRDLHCIYLHGAPGTTAHA